LLQKGEDAGGGGDVRFVEQGDDIPGFVLQIVSLLSDTELRDTYPAKHRADGTLMGEKGVTVVHVD